MRHISILPIVVLVAVGFSCSAQTRLGIATGAGAVGSISIAGKAMGQYAYRNPITLGALMPTLYATIDQGKRDEKHNSLAVGALWQRVYSRSQIDIPNGEVLNNAAYANNVNTRFNTLQLHLSGQRHIVVHPSTNGISNTSYIVGVDANVLLRSSAFTQSQAVASSTFKQYNLSNASNILATMLVGAHIGWQYEKELPSEHSIAIGYVIYSFVNDAIRNPSTIASPLMYTDGYNFLVSNQLFLAYKFR
jgi:hypothetical protein